MNAAEPGSPEFWAQEHGDNVAVIDGDTSLTYGEWNDRSNRVAEGLAAAGLVAGDRIGMRFRLCIEWFIMQRALQKLGVAQVAVSWKLTASEASYILRDSSAKGLACDDKDPSSWLSEDVGLLVTVGQPSSSDSIRLEDLESTNDAPPRFGALRANMVLYTSGTTGAPRGVPPVDPSKIDVDRMLRYGAAVASCPPTPPGVVSLLTLPIHHGAGPGMATVACARGGTIVLLDPFDPIEALQLIERYGVQTWSAVPTMLLRIQALPDDDLARFDLSSLDSLLLGAAPVPLSLKEWIVGTLGDDLLWEGYGSSEAGMITFCAPEHQLARPGTSGLAFEGVEIAIVDDNWKRLPAGETGEIAVNTPSQFDRYLGGEELSDDTLRDGFQRTGDVGHLDEDGFLFVTDRAKDMIVAGGVNIYPAEIEQALIAHPDVTDAAVIGVPHADFGEQPLAFIVTRTGGEISSESLKDHLAGRLSSYKMPRTFEFCDELPRNPMGKVLKNQLRSPYWEGMERNV